MYEYIFKGYSCITTGYYSYQIIEDENGLRLFTNDFSPISHLYRLREVEFMAYEIEYTSYLEEIMSSPDPRNTYFRYLVLS